MVARPRKSRRFPPSEMDARPCAFCQQQKPTESRTRFRSPQKLLDELSQRGTCLKFPRPSSPTIKGPAAAAEWSSYPCLARCCTWPARPHAFRQGWLHAGRAWFFSILWGPGWRYSTSPQMSLRILHRRRDGVCGSWRVVLVSLRYTHDTHSPVPSCSAADRPALFPHQKLFFLGARYPKCRPPIPETSCPFLRGLAV